MPVLVVLEMIAWLDQPHERSRDLEDIGYVLSAYLEGDDMRRWEDTRLASMDAQEQDPFALGCDIATIVQEQHRPLLADFLQRVGDPDSRAFGALSSDGKELRGRSHRDTRGQTREVALRACELVKACS